MRESFPVCPNGAVRQGFNDLDTVRPDLAAEWCASLNLPLNPRDVTPGSSKIVWWRCEQGHEWEARVRDRVSGNGCPYCSNRKVLTGFNDLATTHPDLAAEWHPHRNGDLRPGDVTVGSGRKVWWLGSCGHEWEAQVFRRARGSSCPYCSNRKVLAGFNDLATKNPKLAAEWHPNRNRDLFPNAITVGSSQKVWWLGSCGHEWEATVSARNSGTSCPYCFFDKKAYAGVSDLASQRPDLAAEWHPHRNGDLRPGDVTVGSGRKVWWVGSCGHEWEAQVFHRVAGSSCPYCSNRRVLAGFNDLATTHPDLAAEWHPHRNGDLRPDAFIAGSRGEVWWRCKQGHEWKALTRARLEGVGCPYCSNRRVLAGFNDLATTHPDLAAEWHPHRNGDLRPDAVTAGFRGKVWWRCERDHEWEAQVIKRVRRRSCPHCLKVARIESN